MGSRHHTAQVARGIHDDQIDYADYLASTNGAATHTLPDVVFRHAGGCLSGSLLLRFAVWHPWNCRCVGRALSVERASALVAYVQVDLHAARILHRAARRYGERNNNGRVRAAGDVPA